MKKILLVAAAAAGLASIAPAFASDGTINITGSVTATTCRINGANSPANISVTLPNVSTTSLNADGRVAAPTPFAINLTQCAANTKATTYFEQGGNVDATSGYLKNAAVATPATNVQVQLLNGDNTPIALNGATGAQGSKQITTDATGAGTLNYIAQYVAKGGAAGAGAVSTSVVFTMQYQ